MCAKDGPAGCGNARHSVYNKKLSHPVYSYHVLLHEGSEGFQGNASAQALPLGRLDCRGVHLAQEENIQCELCCVQMVLARSWTEEDANCHMM